MARQRRNIKPMGRVPLHEQINPFYKSPRQQVNDRRRVENVQAERVNRLVDEREEMIKNLPDFMRTEAGRYAADRAVDARHYFAQPSTQIGFGALGLGGAAFGAAGLNALYQQNAEGLPTDGYNVAGRAVNNAVAGFAGGVGIDPLAKARNSVRDAGVALGSANLLEAVAADELMAIEAAQSSADVNVNGELALRPKSEGSFEARVYQVAEQLMQTPIPTAEGPRPMNYDTAINRAIEIVNSDYRSSGYL